MRIREKSNFPLTLIVASGTALADWPYRSMKIECRSDAIEVIDYSEWNEQGQARLLEPRVIDVDKLSTWRHTEDDLNVPDKPLPHKRVCMLGHRKYSVVLTNISTGGYSPPNPVVTITDETNRKSPQVLFDHVELANMPEGGTKFVVSREYPQGAFIKNGEVAPNNSLKADVPDGPQP